MQAIVPDGAAVIEASSPEHWEAGLLPEEAECLNRVVDKRRREFTAGRNCARQALAELGVEPVPILVGEGREPCWPDGIVGSITHVDGYCAAVAAPRAVARTIGIDAVVHAPLEPGVLALVCTEGERERLATLPEEVHWDALTFSAKESLFKAWYPLARRWLAFEEAEVAFDDRNGTFALTLSVLPREPGLVFFGRFAVADPYAFTLVAAVSPSAVAAKPHARAAASATGRTAPAS
jgi:4'-phosphopantetheinyl transferase EntD